jgi:hypothetical protein
MGMHMIPFVHWRDYAANIFAVLDDGFAHREVLERDLVSNRYILVDKGVKFAVILGDDAEHVGTGRKVLDDDYADVIAAIVDEKMRYFCHGHP